MHCTPAAAVVVLLAIATSSRFAVAQYELHQRTLGGRFQAAIACDAARAELVVFGGLGDLTQRTWLRSAAGSWRSTPTSGIPERSGAACAYDAARQRVVTFGGRYGAPGTADAVTRLWDGTAWQVAATSSAPSARSEAAMVYDSARQVVVLFGGMSANGAERQDTWEWNGVSWAERTSAVLPPPRWGHAMAYDAARARTVLFGGYGENNGYHADTWEWDGTAWSLRANTGPSMRKSTAMAWLPATGRCVLFGGAFFNSATDDTWEWDGAAWTARPLAGAAGGPRSGHGLVFDAALGAVTMVGGFHDNLGAESLWTWNGTVWSLLETAPPEQVLGIQAWGRPACHDPVRGETVVVGGTEPGTTRFQTWVWDGTAWSHRQPANSPPYRFDPALCFDPVRQQVLLFGGQSAADFWAWDGTNWIQGPAGPSARSGAGFAFDPARGVAVLFGGFDHTTLTPRDDLWEWNGTTWTPRLLAVRPPARRWPALGFDPLSQSMLLFGGAGTSTTQVDTWRFDGGQWTQLAPAQSPPVAGLRWLLTDPHRGRAVLAGGAFANPSPSYPYELWDWDGTTWLLRHTQPSLTSRSVFDANRARIELLDGAVYEFVIPVDVAGVGHAPLSTLDRPVLGMPLRFDLGAPIAVFAWTFADVATPPAILSGGVFCGNEPLYLDANAALDTVSGPILTIVLPPLPILTQLPLLVQQGVLDPNGCVRTSDALAIRIQAD